MNCQSIIVSGHNKPLNIIHSTISKSSLGANELLIKILVVPIHNADINLIQGTYLFRPNLPFTPGIEGVGKILEIGDNVNVGSENIFSVGQRVLFSPFCFSGTWRSHIVVDRKAIQPLISDVSDLQASIIMGNPVTAYCLLKHMQPLNKGDYFIQNAANSSVGRCLIQLGKLYGYKSINIVRDRSEEEMKEIVQALSELGADYILTESEMQNDKLKVLQKNENITAPRLAINAVGGRSAFNLARSLSENGLIVTYGAMGKCPIELPAAKFIFANLSAVGFHASKWVKQNIAQYTFAMKEIIELTNNKKFFPHATKDTVIYSINEFVDDYNTRKENEDIGKTKSFIHFTD